MRAYFAPCGIGLGHITRCKVVLDRLKEQVPVRAFFATYYDALHYARSVGLDVLEIPPMTIVSKDTGEIDVKETIIYLASRGRLAAIAVSQLAYDLKYIAAVNPDVVVSDTRAMAILAAKMLGIPCICITNQIRFYVPRKKRMLRISRLAEAGILAVIGEIWAMADEILVPDFPEPYTVCYMNLEVPDRLRRRLRFVGPILSKRPEELPDGEAQRIADVDAMIAHVADHFLGTADGDRRLAGQCGRRRTSRSRLRQNSLERPCLDTQRRDGPSCR